MPSKAMKGPLSNRLAVPRHVTFGAPEPDFQPPPERTSSDLWLVLNLLIAGLVIVVFVAAIVRISQMLDMANATSKLRHTSRNAGLLGQLLDSDPATVRQVFLLLCIVAVIVMFVRLGLLVFAFTQFNSTMARMSDQAEMGSRRLARLGPAERAIRRVCEGRIRQVETEFERQKEELQDDMQQKTGELEGRVISPPPEGTPASAAFELGRLQQGELARQRTALEETRRSATARLEDAKARQVREAEDAFQRDRAMLAGEAEGIREDLYRQLTRCADLSRLAQRTPLEFWLVRRALRQDAAAHRAYVARLLNSEGVAWGDPDR